MEHIDTLIIGAGYAGLYAAHLTRKKHGAQHRIMIIERESQIGGRASNTEFGGTTVVTGAGIGRWGKDECLKSLMQNIGFPIDTFIHNPAYAFEPIDVEKTFKTLNRVANTRSTGEKTFREFAASCLGTEEYRRFIQSTGYSDYEKEDAMSTLKLYGMDDNFCCQNAKLFGVPWKLLAERIVEKDRIDVRLNCEAVSLKSQDDGTILVKTKRGPTYVCGVVVVATTISVLRKLFPHNPVYKKIESQPFIRVYGKFSSDTKHIMAAYVKKYTVVNTVLQKIIPMDVAKGVYMIAYSDNKSAIILDKINSKDTYCRLLEKSLGIPGDSLCLTDMKKIYWHEGTHYVKPLSSLDKRTGLIYAAQHPMENVYVVGEAVSNDQGWVEGALKSVRNIYKVL